MSETERVELTNTWGAFFIFVLLTSSLWGAGVVQAYYYFNAYWTDRISHKWLVSVAWLLDTIHQMICIAAIYRVLVSNFGVESALTLITYATSKILTYGTLITALICILVQSFYIRRIYVLSGENTILTATCSILAASQFSLFIAYFSEAIAYSDFSQLQALTGLSIGIGAVGAVADLTIAGAMIFVLLRNHGEGFESTNNIIERITFYTVSTSLLCGICEVLTFGFAIGMPNSLVYTGTIIMLPKLYFNSMLVLLNSRKSLQSILDENPAANQNFSMPFFVSGPSTETNDSHVPGTFSLTDLGIPLETRKPTLERRKNT